jgi:hypothetical protein
MLTRRRSIAEQFFHLFPRSGFTRVVSGFLLPGTQGKFKILAKIANVFFQHRLGPAFAALLRRARIVMRAVQTGTQVRAAFHANLTAARLAVQSPRLAAVVAMACRSHFCYAIQDWKLTSFLQF